MIRYVGNRYRAGIFDMELGEMLREEQGFADSPAFGFSTLERLDDDLRDPTKVLLHGYLQDKDAFIEACIAGPQPLEIVERRKAAVASTAAEHPSEPLLQAILNLKDNQPTELRVFPRRSAQPARRMADVLPQSRVYLDDRARRSA